MLATPFESDATPVYAFDARGVARRLRQPAVVAALAALRVGETMRLTCDGDPHALLRHVNERYAGLIEHHYVERSPERFVVDFARL
jgi:uncharacterized protein (DUF2249 family)